MRKLLPLLLPLLFACQLAGLVEPTPSGPTATPRDITAEPVSSNPDTEISNGPLLGVAVPLPAGEPPASDQRQPIPVNIPAVVQVVEPAREKLGDTSAYQLSEAELDQLGRDGYLARPDQITSVTELYSQPVPLMVTADIVLAATLTTQRDVIRATQAAFGTQTTYDMLFGLVEQSQQQLDKAGDQLSQTAAARNLAIFTLAGKFYDPNWPVPPAVAELVETELVLSQSQSEFESPLLNRPVQYATVMVEPTGPVRVSSWLLIGSPRIYSNQTPAEQRVAGRQIELLLDIWVDGSVLAWEQRVQTWGYLYGDGPPAVDDWLALAEVAQGDTFVLSATQFADPIFRVLPTQPARPADLSGDLLSDNSGLITRYQKDILHAIQPLADRPNGQIQYDNAVIAALSVPQSSREPLVLDPANRAIQLEMRPEIYTNLAHQTRLLAERLVQNQKLDATNADRLLQLERDLLRLKAIAEKQMAGQLPTAEEEQLLADMIGLASTVSYNMGITAVSDLSGVRSREVVGVVPAIFFTQNGINTGTAVGGRLATFPIEN